MYASASEYWICRERAAGMTSNNEGIGSLNDADC